MGSMRQRTMGAALVCVLALAGCSGEDEPPTEGVTTSPTATATFPVAPDEATPTPTPTAAVSQTHVVASGETLSSIASRYGVTVLAIVEANQLANPDVLAIGDELVIPSPQ